MIIEAPIHNVIFWDNSGIKNLNENISRKTEVMRFFIVKGEEANPEPWRGRETRIRRPQEQKAQDIESIDKKLEEILGS